MTAPLVSFSDVMRNKTQAGAPAQLVNRVERDQVLVQTFRAMPGNSWKVQSSTLGTMKQKSSNVGGGGGAVVPQPAHNPRQIRNEDETEDKNDVSYRQLPAKSRKNEKKSHPGEKRERHFLDHDYQSDEDESEEDANEDECPHCSFLFPTRPGDECDVVVPRCTACERRFCPTCLDEEDKEEREVDYCHRCGNYYCYEHMIKRHPKQFDYCSRHGASSGMGRPLRIDNIALNGADPDKVLCKGEKKCSIKTKPPKHVWLYFCPSCKEQQATAPIGFGVDGIVKFTRLVTKLELPALLVKLRALSVPEHCLKRQPTDDGKEVETESPEDNKLDQEEEEEKNEEQEQEVHEQDEPEEEQREQMVVDLTTTTTEEPTEELQAPAEEENDEEANRDEREEKEEEEEEEEATTTKEPEPNDDEEPQQQTEEEEKEQEEEDQGETTTTIKEHQDAELEKE